MIFLILVLAFMSFILAVKNTIEVLNKSGTRLRSGFEAMGLCEPIP